MDTKKEPKEPTDSIEKISPDFVATPKPPIQKEAEGVQAAKDINLADPPMNVPGLRLNVGCGVDYKEGCINIDPYDDTADISAFAQDLPFKDKSVAQVLCYEALEHLPQKEVQLALNEFFRVLKKDGEVIGVVPDMVGACERYLEDPENEWSLARIYGSQGHEGQFHKTGFTPKKLFQMCGYAGFRVINIAYFSEANGVKDIYFQAIK